MISSEMDDTEFDAIARHLSGCMSAGERTEFERRLHDPDFMAVYEGCRRDWEVAAMGRVDVEAAWMALERRIGANRVTALKTAVWWRSNVAKTALSVAATAVIAVSLFRVVGDRPGALAGTLASYQTGAGERKEVKLPDGSAVVLAAMTRLVLREGYAASGQGRREVELIGEGSFEVEHDEARPFLVHAGGVVIEDLGTKFVVRAVEREPVRVAVSEGEVAVARRGVSQRITTLRQRDVAVVADTGAAMVTRGVDVRAYGAWSHGTRLLSFKDEPLERAITDIERWYDVEFEVTEAALLRQKLTVEFADETIDEVLQVIGPMLSVRFEREGRIVRLAPTERSSRVDVSGLKVGAGA